MAERTDGELVRRIAARGPDARDAEAELCRRFGPRARLYGLRHLRSEDRAEELAQAAMLVVLEATRGGRLEDPDRVDRFVLGTCRNLAARAQHDARRAIPTDDAELDVASFVPSFERLDSGALFGCMAKLDARARTVLFLTFHAEERAEAIAEVVETTPGNVRVMRHRALAQLRTCLEGGPP